jgi:LysM repeat protein
VTVRTWLIAIAALLAAGAPARAQDAANETLSYRVRANDSLEVIAAEYYGDRNHAIFIMVENRILHPRPLRPGERLRIPTTRPITTAKGDTFESLANTYLGDARRAVFLADFNNMSAEDTLATGTPLTIPFHVMHTAAASETLNSISLAFFGDGKQADLIKRYNFLDKTALDKGESIAVPIFNVRVRATKLPPIDTDSKARRDHQRKIAADVAAALPHARTAWAQGDFDAVKTVLEKFGDEIEFLDTPAAVEVCLLLGKSHLADDDNAYALEKFSQVLNRKPRHSLNPYRDSPKVIAAWKKAGGRVDGE